jgi:hypothetical protein
MINEFKFTDPLDGTVFPGSCRDMAAQFQQEQAGLDLSGRKAGAAVIRASRETGCPEIKERRFCSRGPTPSREG